MTISITLAPEAEQKLRDLAARSGQSVERYVEELVASKVRGMNGGQEYPAPAAQRTFAELFAPVREEFRSSGMTDEELDALLAECREAGTTGKAL